MEEQALEAVVQARTLSELFASREFMFTALVGAVIVIIDAARRFNEVAFAARPNDVIFSISPRFLATTADYYNAFGIYVALRLTTYALPALAILYVFSERGMTEALGVAMPEFVAAFITHENFPLFWGALVTGVLPTFSFVEDVERSIRRFAHVAGAIPTGVKRLTQLLRRARLRPDGGFDRNRLRTDRFAFLSESDFAEARTPIDRKWARVCYILDYFFDRRGRADVQDAFLDAYRPEIEREESRFRSLQIRYAVHRLGYERARAVFAAADFTNLPRTISAEDPFLEADIDYILDRLEIYLACAIRHDADSDPRAVESLKAIGFELSDAPRRAAGAVGGVLATVLGMVAAAFVGALTADPLLVFTSETLRLTEFPYEVVPGDSVLQRAVGLLVYTLVIVSSVMLGAFMFGGVLFGIFSRGVESPSLIDRPLMNYVLAALLGAVTGLIGLTAMIVDVSRPFLLGEYSWVLYWTPSFFVLGFFVHLFAHGPTTSAPRLLGQGALIGAAYGVAAYASGQYVFAFLGFDGAYLDGASLYFAIISFWTGLFVSAALIYVTRLQRDREVEAERLVAAGPTATLSALP